jgi:hypothetical protein
MRLLLEYLSAGCVSWMKVKLKDSDGTVKGEKKSFNSWLGDVKNSLKDETKAQVSAVSKGVNVLWDISFVPANGYVLFVFYPQYLSSFQE